MQFSTHDLAVVYKSISIKEVHIFYLHWYTVGIRVPDFSNILIGQYKSGWQMIKFMLTLVFGLQVLQYKEVFCVSEHTLIANVVRKLYAHDDIKYHVPNM